MSTFPIKVHQCISGFTQSERRCHGVLKLSEKLHELGFNNRISRVSLRPWNDDWATVAENIWLLGQHHDAEVVVNIYAYSWGGGWGAVQLAQELQKRGITVWCVVASDAVYRHPLLLMRWISLLGRNFPFSPRIKIPSNVTHVVPFHQTLNRPQGHRIVAGKGFSGVINPSVEVSATHQYMDDADEFHTAAIKAAERLKEIA